MRTGGGARSLPGRTVMQGFLPGIPRQIRTGTQPARALTRT